MNTGNVSISLYPLENSIEVSILKTGPLNDLKWYNHPLVKSLRLEPQFFRSSCGKLAEKAYESMLQNTDYSIFKNPFGDYFTQIRDVYEYERLLNSHLPLKPLFNIAVIYTLSINSASNFLKEYVKGMEVSSTKIDLEILINQLSTI